MASKNWLQRFRRPLRSTPPAKRGRSPVERADAMKQAMELYRHGQSLEAAATEAGVPREGLGAELYGEIRSRRTLNDEQVLWAQKKLAERTISSLADELQVSRKTLRRELDRVGAPPCSSGRRPCREGRLDPKSRRDSEVEEMWRLYQRERSCRVVGKLLGVSASTVSRKLNAAGHRLR